LSLELVWDTSLTDKTVTDSSWTLSSISGVITTHILNLVGHYAGQCYSWIVVSEAFDDSGKWRKTAFYNVLGQDYVALSHAAAAVADSSAQLYYADYGIETSGAKQTAAVNLVKNLTLSSGAPIMGVAFQGKFTVGSTPSLSALVAGFKAFTAIGVNVVYSQLQVAFSSSDTPDDNGLAQQASDYATAVAACLQVTNCIGITVADFDDRYGTDNPYLWDADLNKKPAYDAVCSALASKGNLPPPKTTSYSQPATTSSVASVIVVTVTAVVTPTKTSTTTKPTTTSSQGLIYVTVTVTATPSTSPTTTTTTTTTTTRKSSPTTTSSKTPSQVFVTVTVTQTIHTSTATTLQSSSKGPTVVTVTVTSTVHRSSSTTSPPAAPSGQVTEYGQCGGSSYTGATKCQSPYTCQSFNTYYFQCVPATTSK
jgi:endo-1,4-beta-xylanase